MEKTKNLTDGNIMGTLVRFAVPVLLAMFLQSLYGGVYLLIVGQFAETADVSGVATGSMLMHTVTAVIIGFAMGVTILIGQKLGAGENEKVARAIGASICLFTVIAAALTLILCLFTDLFCGVLNAPEEAYKETYDYIWVCGLGSVFIIAYNVLGAIFRGLGDSKTPLITVCIACAFNVGGDLFFVAVLGMGAKGAAWATVISQALSVVISLYIISKKTLPFKMTRSMIRFDKPLRRDLSRGFSAKGYKLLQSRPFGLDCNTLMIFYSAMALNSRVTICPRVQTSSGLKVVAEVPLVMPFSAAQATASA